MSASHTQIDRYDVWYRSNRFIPTISLWKDNVNKSIASLSFQPNGSVLPNDFSHDGAAFLFFHLEDFANIIDLLRNEKPIFLWWDGTQYTILTSNTEPVGEGEK